MPDSLDKCPERVIIDTDIGDDIDDLLGLTLALQSPEVDLLGVTTVFKNTLLKARIGKKLARLAGREDIMAVPGISQPLNQHRLAPFLTKVDFTEIPCQYTEDMEEEITESPGDAVDFLIQKTLSLNGELIIVAIGPLTNIAAMLQKAPIVASKVKRLVLMGGAYFANVAEYNIQCDPEAAKVVFESGIPIHGIGLDVTRQCRLSEKDLDDLRGDGSELTDFLYRTIGLWRGHTRNLPYLHDPLAMGTVIRQDFVKLVPRAIAIETQGEYTRGMTFNVTDSNWWNGSPNKANAQVGLEVDHERFRQFFMERILAKKLYNE